MKPTTGKTLAAVLLTLSFSGCDRAETRSDLSTLRDFSYGVNNSDDKKKIDEPIWTSTTNLSNKGHDDMFIVLDDGTVTLTEGSLRTVQSNFERSFSAGFVANEDVAESCASACDEHRLAWQGELFSEAVEFQVGEVQAVETEDGVVEYEFDVESHVETQCVCIEG
ncbi:MAG: hypothetical protein KUG77_15545 [Nannocystaceae bacterium]|nr:hypothetical protein [Nannocystaceae bacterium]